MPVQFPHNDQVPGLTFAGYSGLGAGIGSGVDRLASALQQRSEKRKEEAKRLALSAKAADAFYNALPEDRRPMSPEEWKLQAPMDKAGMMAGVQASARFGAEMAQQLRAAEELEFTKAKRQALLSAPKFGTELGRYAPPGQLPYNIPEAEFERYALPEGQAQPGLREMFSAAGNVGYPLDGDEAASLLRAMAPDATATAGFPVGELGVPRPSAKGQLFVPTSIHGGQLVPDLDYEAGAGAEPPVERTLSNGTLQAWNGKTWQTIPAGRQTPGAITPKIRYTELGRLMGESLPFINFKGNEELKKQFEKWKAEREALEREAFKPEAGDTGLPLPKSKSEMKAGQVYQTTRGPATWDGEKFVK